MGKSVLVYIPCHSDFSKALTQVETLRKDFAYHLEGSPLDYDRLHVVVSVNYFQPNNEDKLRAELLCDEVYYHGNALLGDVNISQGFMVCLRQDHEIFWLLSANDILISGSLNTILNEFQKDTELDLVIATSADQRGPHQENDMRNVNGVISGVAYRTTRMLNYFNVAPFFPWTGWSHLAVIQSAMEDLGGLRVSTLVQDTLFSQTEYGLERNGHVYAHAFLGGLIQGFLFMGSNPQRKKYIRKFVFANFYKMNLYAKRDSQKHEVTKLVNPDHYLSWNQVIAESLIKSYTPFIYLLYLVLKRIPFQNGANSRFLRRIKMRLHAH